MKRYAVTVLISMALSVPGLADVPGILNYQGHLTDNTPQQDPVDATLPMEFRIYGSAVGSDLLWEESWAGVQVVDGIFSVLLGSQTAIPGDLFGSGTSHYLEIEVMGEVLAPRQRLGSVPFSHVADTVDGLDSVQLEESAEIDADVAGHDADLGAHAEIISTHGHDSLYYTEDEIDALIPWGDWTIANDEPGDELRFRYPVAAVLTPVLTLEPPTGTGNVGIGTSTPAEKLDVAGAIRIGNTAGAAEGTIRYTGTDFEGRVANTWTSLSVAQGRADVKTFGAVGDGVTDDSAAVQAAIDSLTEGGTVYFPQGHYVVTEQLTFPNTIVGAVVRQRPYKLEGAGPYFDPRTEVSVTPEAGSILDLRYTAGPKIVTYGTGLLETDGMTFADLDNTFDSAPFLYTTNTTLHIHDCAFYGKLAGHGIASNDAIILGGTSAANPGGDDPNGPFQGYGTVIRDNFFSRIRRAVYGRVFANNVVFEGNTIWSSCGSDLPDGAAIEIDGDPDGQSVQAASGWWVANNLIEMTNYYYGIKTRESQRNAFIANGFYDPSEQPKAYYRFEETGRLNYVVAGLHEDHIPFVEDLATPGNARSTVINYHQNRESAFANLVRFRNKLSIEPDSSTPVGPRVVSLAGTELNYRMVTENSMIISYVPAGGSQIELWQVRDWGNGTIVQELRGTDSRIRNDNGSVAIQSDPDSFLEMGNTAGQGIRLEDGELQFTTTSIEVLTGVGAPSQPAANGSIYLRSDGGAGSTLYVRENGSWIAK